MGNFCLTIPTRNAIIPLEGSELMRILNVFVCAPNILQHNPFPQPLTVTDVMVAPITSPLIPLPSS
jgi:hypothetical protein